MESENPIVPKKKRRRLQIAGSPKSAPKILEPSQTKFKLLIKVAGENQWTDFWWPNRYAVPPGVDPQDVSIPLPLQIEEFGFNVCNMPDPDLEQVAKMKRENVLKRNILIGQKSRERNQAKKDEDKNVRIRHGSAS